MCSGYKAVLCFADNYLLNPGLFWTYNEHPKIAFAENIFS